MSVRSGHKTSRSKVANHNGYDIIKVTEIEYERSIFNPSRYTDYPKRKEVHYDFCKEGNEKRPSQHYGAWASNISECKECIDNFIKDDSIYFTAEEREKYVYKPNRKCDYRYGYDSLMKLLKAHQKASKRMKILIEDRLEDANFHTECGLLAKGDYDGFVDVVTKTYKFREKFEIITETECHRIKDPKRLEAHIKAAIEEYFSEHRMDVGNTTISVKYVENW